ncbi:MAG: hypothetical protein NC548_25220 [Lachnospiraceae bacterium]|nr:hypothetical protein [Lachnospiraceae bacterium]MCM1237105.1 hypothetical protein [Ruminococcus flavefaciens]
MYKANKVWGLGTPIYLADDPIAEEDEEIKKYYRLALEEVRDYLTSVLEKEVEEKGYAGAEVSLLLPLGNMDIRVGEPSGVSEGGQPIEGSNVPDIIYTPIGKMDTYTYTAIITDEENPVRILYDYCFGNFYRSVHGTLEGQPWYKEGYLSFEVLKYYCSIKFNDPLNLYKFDSLWHDLDKFFSRGIGRHDEEVADKEDL